MLLYPFFLSFFLLIFSLSLSAQPTDLWLEAWHSEQTGTSAPTGRTVTKVNAGYVYTAYHQLNTYGLYDLVLSQQDDRGNLNWERTFNLTTTDATVLIGDMGFDANGHIIITGAVYNGSNDYDVLTVKIHKNSTVLWHRLYDGPASYYDGGTKVAVDGLNRIYITGGVSTTTNLMDVLTLCYTSNGTLDWDFTLDGSGLFDVGSHIRRDGGKIVTVGLMQVSADSWRTATQYRNYDTGALLSSTIFSDTTTIKEVRDIAVDDDDHVYITGWVDSGNEGNIITLKLDEGASLDWVSYYDGAAHLQDEPFALSLTDAGNIIVGGFTQTTGQGKDGLVLNYKPDGSLLWAQTTNGEADGDDIVTDLVINEVDQEIYLSGVTQDNNTDDFLAEVRQLNSGASVWREVFNGPVGGDDQAEVITKDEERGMILTGQSVDGSGNTRITKVRYERKSILIPPTTETPGSALGYRQNRGQLLKTDSTAADSIKFYNTGTYPSLYLQDGGLSWVFAQVDTSPSTQDTFHRIDLAFGDVKDEVLYPIAAREAYHNYYLGHIPEGRVRVPQYDRLVHTDAFAGIDVQYYANGADVQYLIVVAPGADPDDIELIFTGHDGLSVNGSGELVVASSLGDLVLPQALVSFINPVTGNPVATSSTASYSVLGNKVTISLSTESPTNYTVLKIAQTTSGTSGGNANLEWCSFFGGELEDFVNDIAVRTTANGDDFYVTGRTSSIDFPVNAGFQETPGSFKDAFISAIDEDINLIWSTYFGGPKDEEFLAMVDAPNYLVAVGTAKATGVFPLLDNGIAYFDDENDCGPGVDNCSDGLIAAFRYDGTLEFSTFFGRNSSGFGEDQIQDIAIGPDGNFYLTGLSTLSSIDIAFDGASFTQSFGRSFISKFSPDFSDLIWSTHFSAETSREIAVDPNGNIFIAGTSFGSDITPVVAENSNSFTLSTPSTDDSNTQLFITKISPSPHTILWSTYYGGDGIEIINGLALNSAGEPMIVGRTASNNFQTTSPSVGFFDDTYTGGDAFFVNFTNTGEQKISSLVGGSTLDEWNDIWINEDDQIFLGGIMSTGMPVAGPTGTFQESGVNGYFAVLDPTNFQSVWTSYIGGQLPLNSVLELEGSINDRVFMAGVTNAPLSPPTSSNIFPLMAFGPNPGSFFSSSIPSGQAFNLSGYLARFDGSLITKLDEQGLHNTESDWAVFPNPATHQLYLQNAENSEGELILSTLSGQQILKQPIELRADQPFLLTLPDLAAGVYLVSWQNSVETKTQKLMIVSSR